MPCLCPSLFASQVPITRSRESQCRKGFIPFSRNQAPLIILLLPSFLSRSYFLLHSQESLSFSLKRKLKMSCFRNWVFRRRNRLRLIISLLSLLASNFTPERFVAEGRKVSKLVEVAQSYSKDGISGREEKVVTMMRNQIGSRPPRCERKCGGCGHCEAIQVPVAPQQQQQRRLPQSRRAIHTINGAAAAAAAATSLQYYSRGEYISNYKPMTWKCKCGDAIFNP